jgi:hypothetical protein
MAMAATTKTQHVSPRPVLVSYWEGATDTFPILQSFLLPLSQVRSVRGEGPSLMVIQQNNLTVVSLDDTVVDDGDGNAAATAAQT